MVGYIGYQSEYDLGGIEKINNSKNSIVRNGLVLHLDAAKRGFVAGSLVYKWFSTTGLNPTTSQDFNALFVSNLQGQGLHTTGTIDWPEISLKPSYITVSENFAWEVSGALVIEEPGNYVFETRSDDGNQLEINNQIVASFYGSRGTPVVGEKTAPIFLSQGYHSFRYRMQQGTGGAGAQVRWQTPSGTSFVVIPQSNLGYFETGASNTGNSWRDLSGNSIVHTISSSKYFPKDEGSFLFNGSSSLIVAPENSLLNSQSFTIDVIVSPASLSQNGFWFEKGQVNTQYSLFMEGGNIVFRGNNGTSFVNFVAVTASTYMSTNQWYNVVGTFVSGQQRLYINGVQVGSGTVSATIPTNANGTSIGVYGGFNGSRSYWYNGKISSVKIYNRSLSANEVNKNFNVTRARYGI
jgi:hypothetical protein